MPIDGISEIRRLPRIGIIRLGEKAVSAGGKEYPKKLDHFNLKDAPGVAAVFGPEPKVLDIMLPHENIDVFFPQWRKAYGKSSGLFCKGDGNTASRIRFGVSDGKGEYNKIPTGQSFDAEGEKFVKDHGLKVSVGDRFDMPCLGENCSFTQKGVCKPIGQMMFLIPKVPGVGVFQISTGSFNSLVDVNSCVEMIRSLAGRVSMIPLRLSLVPKSVNVDNKKIGIFHLKLEYAGAMTDLLKYRDVKYLSADLLPQIENETPEDIVSHAGETLDKTLLGHDKIAGPEDSTPDIGVESWTVSGKIGIKDKTKGFFIKSPNANYSTTEEVAKTANKNFNDGDIANVSWAIIGGIKTVTDLNRTAAVEMISSSDF